jgi:hypothetical protein
LAQEFLVDSILVRCMNTIPCMSMTPKKTWFFVAVFVLLADSISAASVERQQPKKKKSTPGPARLLRVMDIDAGAQTIQESAPGAWVAGPFGDCISQCGSDNPAKTIAFRNRTITCRSLQNELLSDEACYGLTKPCAYQPCHCGPSLCISKDCSKSVTGNAIPPAVAKAEMECEEDLDEFNFICLGCYSLSFGDNISTPSTPADWTCVNWNGTNGSTCRSGLPFYRMQSNSLTPALCFEYCTGLGFDLFGLVQGSECRCGASKLNQVVWARAQGASRTYLELPLPPQHTCEVSMDKCPVRAYRFTGHFESGGSVPAKLLRTRAVDLPYIDSIMLGRNISSEKEEDPRAPRARQIGLTETDEKEKSRLQQTPGKTKTTTTKGPSWNRPCNDDPGCNSGPPWTDRVTTAPAGAPDVWQEYVVVRYRFDPTQNIDDTRKEAFRAATNVWTSVTCVTFSELSNPDAPFLQAGVYDAGSCYATPIGSPGANQYSEINLGWCNSMLTKGSMVHELGHVLGLMHTQTRPDAAQTYYGKGPYVSLQWQNIPSDWVPQYQPDYGAYTGSADDGSGDVQIGYAPYDFESIMHYPSSGGSIITIPNGRYDNLIGNRQHLSQGDITLVLDNYRCRLKPGAMLPTTTSTTTTTTNLIGRAQEAANNIGHKITALIPGKASSTYSLLGAVGVILMFSL